MKQDCDKYAECRKPVQVCTGKCPEYRKIKWVTITGKTAGKDKIMKWEWNGHKLPPLYRLVMRIIMIPVAHTARLILVFAIFIGWGELEASRLWRDTK
jgi:hypothetical protein